MSPLWWFYFLAACAALVLVILSQAKPTWMPLWVGVLVLAIIHIISSLMALK